MKDVCEWAVLGTPSPLNCLAIHGMQCPPQTMSALLPSGFILTLGKDKMSGIQRQGRDSHNVLGFSLCPHEMTKWVDPYPCHWNSEPLCLGSTPTFDAQQCCALGLNSPFPLGARDLAPTHLPCRTENGVCNMKSWPEEFDSRGFSVIPTRTAATSVVQDTFSA